MSWVKRDNFVYCIVATWVIFCFQLGSSEGSCYCLIPFWASDDFFPNFESCEELKEERKHTHRFETGTQNLNVMSS